MLSPRLAAPLRKSPLGALFLHTRAPSARLSVLQKGRTAAVSESSESQSILFKTVLKPSQLEEARQIWHLEGCRETAKAGLSTNMATTQGAAAAKLVESPEDARCCLARLPRGDTAFDCSSLPEPTASCHQHRYTERGFERQWLLRQHRFLISKVSVLLA